MLESTYTKKGGLEVLARDKRQVAYTRQDLGTCMGAKLRGACMGQGFKVFE